MLTALLTWALGLFGLTVTPRAQAARSQSPRSAKPKSRKTRKVVYAGGHSTSATQRALWGDVDALESLTEFGQARAVAAVALGITDEAAMRKAFRGVRTVDEVAEMLAK